MLLWEKMIDCPSSRIELLNFRTLLKNHPSSLMFDMTSELNSVWIFGKFMIILNLAEYRERILYLANRTCILPFYEEYPFSLSKKTNSTLFLLFLAISTNSTLPCQVGWRTNVLVLTSTRVCRHLGKKKDNNTYHIAGELKKRVR
jgi:hypothetical protein